MYCFPKPRFAAANFKRLLPFLDAVDRTVDRHFRFTVGGEDSALMPLSLEYLEYNFNGCPVYAMMHYYKQNGDVMRDPDMTFYVDRKDGCIIPMSFCQDGGFPVHDEVFVGDGKTYYRRTMTDLDHFLNDWTKNILAQGYSPAQADDDPETLTPEQFAEALAE